MNDEIKVGLVSKVRGFVTGIPAELVERRRTGRTMFFAGLKKDPEGNYRLMRTKKVVNAKSVGEPRQVGFITLHDMMPRAVLGAMTDAIYLEEGFDANAVWIDDDSFKRTGELSGTQDYQPMKIPDKIYKAYARS
jgi:hypothetical protein